MSDARPTDAGGPQDRPFVSAPMGAALATVGFYLFWGSAPVVLFFAVENVLAGGDPGGAPVLFVIPFTAIPILIVALGIRWGRIWALRLLRLLSWLAVGAVALSAALSGLVLAGLLGRGPGQADRIVNAEFMPFELILLVPLGWWLLRKLYTVRWLDPASLPSEWEPPVNRGGRPRG